MQLWKKFKCAVFPSNAWKGCGNTAFLYDDEEILEKGELKLEYYAETASSVGRVHLCQRKH